jgi:hypothetical protein
LAMELLAASHGRGPPLSLLVGSMFSSASISDLLRSGLLQAA